MLVIFFIYPSCDKGCFIVFVSSVTHSWTEEPLVDVVPEAVPSLMLCFLFDKHWQFHPSWWMHG
jgi:hypothetical protein